MLTLRATEPGVPRGPLRPGNVTKEDGICGAPGSQTGPIGGKLGSSNIKQSSTALSKE